MKPHFSFDDAVGAPFALLRRRPLYLFAWGLPIAVLMAASYSALIPMMAALPLTPGPIEGGPGADVFDSMRLQALINGLNAVMYLVMLVTWTAAGRATLSPGLGDRFLFLRLGMDEVRVAVVLIAVFLGWYLALLLLILLGVGLGAALWSLDRTVLIGAMIVYGLLVLALSVWALMRTSLIAPASLILQRFAFAEGWALTRGQVWKLIGLNLAVWVLTMVITLLVYGLCAGIVIGAFFAQGLTWPQNLETLGDLQPLVRPMIVPAIVAVLPLTFFAGWTMALYAGPQVRAARQLLDGVSPVRHG